MTVSAQQDRELIEPSNDTLELHTIYQEDRDRRLLVLLVAVCVFLALTTWREIGRLFGL